MKKAVFFDRDGVVVKNVEGIAPTKVQDLELILGSVPVIKRLQKNGYKIFIVSNQPDIALGKIDEKTRKALVKKFEKLLKEYKLSANGIYYCFHHPRGIIKKYSKDCDCRKPKPGMLLKAIHDDKIEPAKSFIIGDRATDIKAGSLAGVKTILLDPKDSQQNYLLEYNVKPDFVIKRLPEAIKILNNYQTTNV